MFDFYAVHKEGWNVSPLKLHSCYGDAIINIGPRELTQSAGLYPRKMMEMSAMNRKVMQALIETISKKVDRFTKTEIERLIQQFHELVGEQSSPGRAAHGLERGRFRGIMHNIFGLTDDMIIDGIFRTFDKDSDGFITVEEWIEGLAIFLRGTLDEKIKFSFHVYDLNGDKYISREEMFHMLKNSIIKQPTEEDPDEGVKDLVDITFKKMDHDLDGRLSFEDFENSVQEENLLLEAFGTCFPDHMTIDMFEQQVFQEQVD